MIAWTGSGFLVPVAVFGSLLAMELVTETVTRDDAYYQANAWPMAFGFLLSALVVRWLAERLGEDKARVVRDEITGERRLSGEEPPSFMWIPMRYWPPLLAGIGVAVPFLR